jgi:DNA-binding transcriptional ArsR family regulator
VPTYAFPSLPSNGFAALADPTRREIFERVAARRRSVGELADGLPISRPAVSQHLKVLKDAGLVSDRADGSRRIYELDLAGVQALRTYLDRFWNQALAAFKVTVEQQQQQEETR